MEVPIIIYHAVGCEFNLHVVGEGFGFFVGGVEGSSFHTSNGQWLEVGWIQPLHRESMDGGSNMGVDGGSNSLYLALIFWYLYVYWIAFGGI